MLLYWLITLISFVLLLETCASSNTKEEDDESYAKASQFLYIATSFLLIADHISQKRKRQRPPSSSPCKRVHKLVPRIFTELGKYYVRHAYQMDEASFWKLYGLLRDHMKRVIAEQPKKKKKRKGKGKKKCKASHHKKKKKGATNDIISLLLRLSVALQYFAGGDPYNIMVSHGMSHTEVYNSIWIVVDAINRCQELAFSFPEDHGKQREIAKGFAARSHAGFDMCCGCIDGMLLWIKKPNQTDCEVAKVGEIKFFCGRKGKFGLCFQGICDSECHFLDVCIAHPASTSDYLTFCTNSLKHNKLEKEGFLAPGLCLFGDSAYVNNEYMATPSLIHFASTHCNKC
jgi:hypothetical protein